jgi:hypothetical protein
MNWFKRAIALKKNSYSLLFGVAAVGSSGFFSWPKQILPTRLDEEATEDADDVDGGLIPLGLAIFGIDDDAALSLDGGVGLSSSLESLMIILNTNYLPTNTRCTQQTSLASLCNLSFFLSSLSLLFYASRILLENIQRNT